VRDLSNGVIVVMSGGGFDEMNPPEVRDRMDEYIADVNDDPYVKQGTGEKGLTFKLLQKQKHEHLHQTDWRKVCLALKLLTASPLIVVGHSNGGAAAMNLARCLAEQTKSVDLLFTCDSVLTLDDNGGVYTVPENVVLNVNPYVIPTPKWILLPFPIGQPNHRDGDESLDGILNIGLAYNLGGALAHRNAFYEIAGGDKTLLGNHKRPQLLLETTLAVLRKDSQEDIFKAAEASLRILATKSKVRIELESTGLKKTLRP
jgi:hypothetical protein